MLFDLVWHRNGNGGRDQPNNPTHWAQRFCNQINDDRRAIVFYVQGYSSVLCHGHRQTKPSGIYSCPGALAAQRSGALLKRFIIGWKDD